MASKLAIKFAVLEMELDTSKVRFFGPYSAEGAILRIEILSDQHAQWAEINNGGRRTVQYSTALVEKPTIFPENKGWLRTGVKGTP